MRRRQTRICLTGLAVSLCVSTFAVAAPPAVYDDAPDHPWNKLYHALYLRGLEVRDDLLETKLFSDWPAERPREVLDPLIWANSRYLATDPTHSKIIALLDEFIATGSAEAITDLRKRAMFQRDLWAVFDWAAFAIPWAEQSTDRSADYCRALADRLAAIMYAVALDADELATLAESTRLDQSNAPPEWAEPEPRLIRADKLDQWYEYLADSAVPVQESPDWDRVAQRVQPIFAVSQRHTPPPIAGLDRDWVTLGLPGSDRPMARDHIYSFHGRQIFTALMRLPNGPDATRAYLSELQQTVAGIGILPFDTEKSLSDFGAPNFPAGTIVALVRRPVTITKRGELKPLPFVEKIQYIVHDERAFDHILLQGRTWRTSIVGEFRLFRSDFFNGGTGLRRIPATAPEYRTVFRTHGIDELELAGQELRKVGNAMDCTLCHQYRSPHRVTSVRSVGLLPHYEDVWTGDALEGGLASSQSAEEEKALAIVRTRSQTTWHELMRRWPDREAARPNGE